MASTGSYALSALLLALLVLSLGFSAVRLRQSFMPEWEGAPAHLVEAVLGIALLIWVSELLGLVNLLYAGTLVASAVIVAAAVAFGPRVLSRWPPPCARTRSASPPLWGTPAAAPPAGEAMTVVAIGVVAVVFAHWGLTAKDALGRGIFNFDSLWYHLPFAVEMAHSHSVTGSHYTETVFTNWFYPQNSELLHAVGILLTGRDTLSLFINFGWLALAFLAAWCIGRPYGKQALTTVAAAVVLECHTLVVREPGAAKNDLMAAALLLSAIAILVNARWGAPLARWRGSPIAEDGQSPSEHMGEATATGPVSQKPPLDAATGPASRMLPLAMAGLATGMAVGTKSTAVAMAAALTVAVLFLAPAGRRWVAAGWWFAAALAGGGYWYLRNLVIAGNPLPQLEHLGPISLQHPNLVQSGRPDFSIVHYATDTGVWSDYFDPGLHQAFGALWPLVLLGGVVGGALALAWGRPRVLRWMGAVALFGMLAYLFTPLSAAGAEGVPTGFAINIRYVIPALLTGFVLLPLALDRLRTHAPPAGGTAEWAPHRGGRGEAASEHMGEGRRDRTRGWIAMSLLVLLLVITDRPDATLRDPDRLFGWLVALLVVLVPAALVYLWRRGAPRRAVLAGFAVLVAVVVVIGYPVQRSYLRDRYANADPEKAIPGMRLDAAYAWARDVHDARIGLAGTTAGFLEYGFYGTDLSNRVRYIGAKGPHGGFEPIATCGAFRAAVNAADLDYLVTSPFLDFIEPGRPISSPEAGWLRDEPAVVPIEGSGPVTVWRVRGQLDPRACGPGNAPLREIPQQPAG